MAFKNQVFKRIQAFYDDIFQYHYLFLKEKTENPEVTPIFLISMEQTTNLLVLFIVIAYGSDQNILIDSIKYIFFILLVIVGLCNYLVYDYKERKNIILGRKKKLQNSFFLIAYSYLIVSLALPILLIFIFQSH